MQCREQGQTRTGEPHCVATEQQVCVLSPPALPADLQEPLELYIESNRHRNAFTGDIEFSTIQGMAQILGIEIDPFVLEVLNECNSVIDEQRQIQRDLDASTNKK